MDTTSAPKMKWHRSEGQGWNVMEYRSECGRYLIRSRMMASSRNGYYRKEWGMWVLATNPAEGRPTAWFDTLGDAKANATAR